MAMLTERDRGIIKNRFDQELVDDVTLFFVAQRESPLMVPGQPSPAAACREQRQLLDELAELSPKLRVEDHDLEAEADQPMLQDLGVAQVPALIITRDGLHGVRFYGLTSGYEFATVIEDIVDVSKNQTGLSDATKQALAGITTPVHIQVFVTPT